MRAMRLRRRNRELRVEDDGRPSGSVRRANPTARTRLLLGLPLAVFAAIVALLYSGFGLERADILPSALIDEPFPQFDLPTLGGDPPRGSRADLPGEAHLVNVWATWCPTCAAEHDELARISAATGIGIVGVNYKDDPAAARAWLARRGDPYLFHVVDAEGDLGVELGVYGAPETFVVDAAGVIRYKQVGAVTAEVWRRRIAPLIAAMAP